MSTENDGSNFTTSNHPTNCDICSGPNNTDNNPTSPHAPAHSGWRGDTCEIGEFIE